MKYIAIIYLFSVTTILGEPLPIDDIDSSRKVSYAKDIEPVFKRSCIACHNSTKAKGKLNLESVSYMMEGADGFDVIVPGKSDESLVFLLAAHQEESFMPPPKNKSNAPNLTPEELGLLRLWIDQGAIDDGVSAENKKINFAKMSDKVNAIYSVAISPDNQFAAAGRGNKINIYHLPSGKDLGRLIDPSLEKLGASAHIDIVGSMAFSSQGTLASAGFRNVKLWKKLPPKELFKFELKGSNQSSFAVDKKTNKSLHGNEQGEIYFYSPDAKQLQLIYKHSSEIKSISFVSENTYSFIGSDGFLAFLDINKKEPKVSTNLQFQAQTIEYIENVNLVAIGTADGMIKILSLDDGFKVVGEMKAHSENVSLLKAYGSGGNEIVSFGSDNIIKFWKAEGTKISKTREINNGAGINDISIADDFKLIAAVEGNEKIKVWNINDGKLKFESNNKWVLERQAKSDEQKKNVSAKVLEERKKQVAASEKKIKDDSAALDKAKEAEKNAKAELDKKKIELVASNDVKTKAEADVKTKEEAKDEGLKAAQDQLKKATEAADAKDKEFKDAERKNTEAIRSREIAERFLKRANDADKNTKQLLAQAEKKLANATQIHVTSAKLFAESESQLGSIIFSEDGAQVFAGSNDGKIYSWEVESGKPSDFMEVGDDSINLIGLKENKFSLINGNKWLEGLHNEHVWVMDRMIGNIDDPKTIVDRVNALGFSPDGKLLATGGGVPSRSGELKVWNVSTGELVSSNVDSHSDTISGLVFSPSGQSIATSATDRFVKVFKVNGGDLEKSFEGHTNHVLDVTWSADGFLLASAGADNVVKIWDYEKGTQKETVKGHSKAVGSIDYLGLTGTLLSSSGDKSVRLSNKPLPDSDTFIHVSGASHDGSHIAAGGEDSVLRIWTASDSKLILKLQ